MDVVFEGLTRTGRVLTIAWEMRSIDGSGTLRAYIDGVSAGACDLWERDHGVFELADLYVGDVFRGQGVGHAVVVTCIAEARRVGATLLYLSISPVDVSNKEHLYSFYQKCGFHIVKEVTQDHSGRMELRW